jgi:hypothetical protein
MPQIWPTNLPQQFDKDGYQDSFADNRLATNPELGPALIRSRVSNMPRRVGGVMKMTKAQLDYFRYFWRTMTLDGKLPFEFPDPVFGYGWRRNWLPNSGNGGAVIGSPGVLPTSWSGVGVQNGVNKSVTGIGVEGYSYVDVRFQGVPTQPASGTINSAEIYFHPTGTAIPAASNQWWTASLYARLMAGSLTNVTHVRLLQYDNPYTTGVGVNFVDQLDDDPLTSQRYEQSMKMPAAGVNGTFMRFQIYATVGHAIDLTIRLAAPQLERYDHATAFMLTPNEANPIARFAAGGAPPQPSFLGGNTWAVNMELEIFEK